MSKFDVSVTIFVGGMDLKVREGHYFPEDKEVMKKLSKLSVKKLLDNSVINSTEKG